MTSKPAPRSRVVAWALYDWANSAFATSVMAGFFPVFFKQHWAAGLPPAESTFRLGAVNSIASAAVVLLAPLLGAIGDARGIRKRLLGAFAALGVLATAGLFFVGEGAWLPAAGLYAAASVGFMAGNALYDALLLGVADEGRREAASALGFGLGYLGGGLLFLAQVLVVLSPGLLGLDAAGAVRASFLTVSLWWALFSLPLFLRVPEPPASGPRGRGALRAGASRVVRTLREVRSYRPAALFLLAYWLYIDGVDTIVRMALDYGLSIGLGASDLLVALLVTQFVGFPAAIAFGRLGERIGPKRGILAGIAVYAGVTAWAAFMRSAAEFYALAVVVGLVQGGVQALSRSLFSRMVPPGREGEFFGFYNVLGKFAAVVGPALVGAAGALTGEPRIAIATVLVLFVAGAALLLRVDVEAGARAARAARDAGGEGALERSDIEAI